ncbi:MAG: hypothetical protein SFZ03_01310 [Candidatus Melainabacteria bacterium]|nr:hypothetical protein [Candidatus Melainabacteria bacterium]
MSLPPGQAPADRVAASFFDYTCDRTGEPVCERVQLVNLALGYEEALYSLSCLAQDRGLSELELMQRVREYVMSRDCFRKPWLSFDATACPRLQLAEPGCYCQ